MDSNDCTRCQGRGVIILDDRPAHTTYPNPRWEPAEPSEIICSGCDGTGRISHDRG